VASHVCCGCAEPSSNPQAPTKPPMLFTVTLTVEAVVVLPAASRAKAVRVCEPFVAETVFQLTEYGEVVSSVPRFGTVELELDPNHSHIVRGIRRHTDRGRYRCPADRACHRDSRWSGVRRVGHVTVIVLVAVFPAASRATAEMVCDPLATDAGFQLTEYGTAYLPVPRLFAVYLELGLRRHRLVGRAGRDRDRSGLPSPRWPGS